MPTKRLAMTTDGKLTYCTADDEHVGKGRCNHIAHQKVGEDQQAFLERANTIIKEKNKEDGLDLEGIERVNALGDFLPHVRWMERNKGAFEGISSDGKSLRFLRMFSCDDFESFYDNAINTVFEKDADSELKTKRLFEELDLPYTADEWDDSNTLIAHILKQNMERFNPYPEWGEPQIEVNGYSDPEAAWGYSWPLDSILDKLSDNQIQEADCAAEWSKFDIPNMDDPTLQRLYSRAMKIKDDFFKNNDVNAKKEMIERGDHLQLQLLEDDPNPEVRKAVAKKGFDLAKLIGDPNEDVRAEVAKHGYGLDKLIHDPALEVRAAVAEQGFGLDKLVDDPSNHVRMVVAKQGYGLDKLINDPDRWVRADVASQGYGLDKLVSDSSPLVRQRVAIKGYGLDKLVDDPAPEVRAEVARNGYGLDKLAKDKAWQVQRAIAEVDSNPEKFINSPEVNIRMAIAQRGYGLDRLVNDPDPNVRLEVLKQGYGFEKLVSDEDPDIRQIIAQKGYGLDKLVNDNEPQIRAEVASHRYGLDILIDDEDPDVRYVVAEQGYGLNKLVNDRDPKVAEMAKKQLEKQKQ